LKKFPRKIVEKLLKSLRLKLTKNKADKYFTFFFSSFFGKGIVGKIIAENNSINLSP